MGTGRLSPQHIHTLTMDGSEPTSPLMIALSAGLAIATPLMFLVFSRRQAAAPSGVAAEPPPASDKPAYRSARELRDELSGEGLLEEAGRRKDAANGLLQQGLLEPAMQAYLSAIWLLKVHPSRNPNPDPNPNRNPSPNPNRHHSPNPNPSR